MEEVELDVAPERFGQQLLAHFEAEWRVARHLQGYLAHKKQPPPRTLPCLGTYGGPRGGGLFLMSEVPL